MNAKATSITVRVPVTQKTALVQLGKDKGQTLSELARRAFAAMLTREWNYRDMGKQRGK